MPVVLPPQLELDSCGALVLYNDVSFLSLHRYPQVPLPVPQHEWQKGVCLLVQCHGLVLHARRERVLLPPASQLSGHQALCDVIPASSRPANGPLHPGLCMWATLQLTPLNQPWKVSDGSQKLPTVPSLYIGFFLFLPLEAISFKVKVKRIKRTTYFIFYRGITVLYLRSSKKTLQIQ